MKRTWSSRVGASVTTASGIDLRTREDVYRRSHEDMRGSAGMLVVRSRGLPLVLLQAHLRLQEHVSGGLARVWIKGARRKWARNGFTWGKGKGFPLGKDRQGRRASFFEIKIHRSWQVVEVVGSDFSRLVLCFFHSTGTLYRSINPCTLEFHERHRASARSAPDAVSEGNRGRRHCT